MKIKDKIMMSREDLEKYGAINIVALGDSVTHGAVAGSELNYETVYWNRLKNKILAIRDYVPVNVLNAGIGGTDAVCGVRRLESQVLKHEPDLVIVCFGLNDVNGPIERFLDALKEIFSRCKEIGSDVIYMTPNMLNTKVLDDVSEKFREYAFKTADMQNSGRMDDFMTAACDLARSMDVAVCDCYSEWKKLSETQDINLLLANRINHPTREMHELFADKLFKTIFGEEKNEATENDDTMYK